MRRKLKSGKSMATKTSGRRSRAAATSRRSIAYERGRTRSASVRPVTVSPWKSPISSPPAAARRWPPKPKISADGTRRRSSAASAPAYRSPDASPHDIMIFIARVIFVCSLPSPAHELQSTLFGRPKTEDCGPWSAWIGRDSVLRTGEERVVDGGVQRDAAQRARQDRPAVVYELRLERHRDAVNLAVVGEDLFDLRRACRPAPPVSRTPGAR